MSLTPSFDAIVATDAAERGGRVLLDLRSAAGGLSGVALGDEGDRAANAVIIAALREAYPGDAVLSEEAADDLSRLSAERTWIIDPLDGTREFTEPGRVDWAVHVALAVGNKLVAGAVALPGLAVTFRTASPPRLPTRHTGPPRIVVSRTRPPPVATEVARQLDAEVIPMGSAGAKAMAVLRGEADIYLHAGGQYEWDSAAPVAVALAAGMHASRIDGSPLRYNQPDPWLPDLLICRPELAARVIALARAAPGRPATT